jgi:ATP-dependent Clp protease protease subunit
LAAGTPGKRLMLPHARVVIHQPTMEADYGHGSDLQIQATEILRVRATMETLLAKYTGRSRKQVRADIDRDTILTSTKALAYGVVDEILGSRKPPPSATRDVDPALNELQLSA